MADIAVTATRVAMVFPHFAERYSFIASTTITAGAAVYLIASSTGAGTLALADASSAGTANPVGIALNGGGAGQAIDVLKRGHVAGFTFTQDYFVPIYLSDTNTGILADAAGSTSKIVGRVVPMSNSDLTKVLYVDLVWS